MRGDLGNETGADLQAWDTWKQSESLQKDARTRTVKVDTALALLPDHGKLFPTTFICVADELCAAVATAGKALCPAGW